MSKKRWGDSTGRVKGFKADGNRCSACYARSLGGPGRRALEKWRGGFQLAKRKKKGKKTKIEALL